MEDWLLHDSHAHTKWSGDSEADPVAMILAAKAAGLKGITITDHLDWDFPTDPGYFDLDVPAYLAAMRKLADAYTDENFTVRVGIELGLQTHLVKEHNELMDTYGKGYGRDGLYFDHVIGSVHQLDGKDPYYNEFFEGRRISEVYRQYFETILENLKVFSRIDALGHLDYICRYGQRVAKSRGEDGRLVFDDYRDVITEILGFLIDHDIALEINTGSFRHGIAVPNPSYEIIDHYRSLGGRRFTLGADAHKPEDVAVGFAAIRDYFKKSR